MIFSQIIAAPVTSVAFQIHGNANFRLSSEDSKITGVLSASGVISVILAIYVFYIVLSGYIFLLQTYLGMTLLLVGLLVYTDLKWKFSWKKSLF